MMNFSVQLSLQCKSTGVLEIDVVKAQLHQLKLNL